MVEVNNKKKFTSMQITVVSFLLLIFVGGLLLAMPVCNTKPISFFDALFASTSAVCVTGLSTVVAAEQFTFWGELIILLLIQIGGLGFMTFVTLIFVFLKKRITLKERIMLGDSFGSNALKGLVKLTKEVFIYTILFEIIGAILLSIRTVPIYGIKSGLWKAIFLSISSFCSAGLDLFGSSNLAEFATDKLVCTVIMILSILGGLGFLVWNEVREKFNYKIKNKISFKKMISTYSVHTKLVFTMTIILIIFGTAVLFLTEYNNANTIGDMNLSDKLFVSLFQSVNVRSTGITTVPISNLSDSSKIIIAILMLIGGVPGSTSGGIKIVTFGLLMMTAFSVIINEKHVVIFKREIPEETIRKAIALLLLALTIVTFSTIILTITDSHIDAIDLLFEVVSAFSTCGLSVGITTSLSTIGKLMIMLLMYTGRVTTITMTMAIFKGKIKVHDIIRYPQEDIIIG